MAPSTLHRPIQAKFSFLASVLSRPSNVENFITDLQSIYPRGPAMLMY